MKVAYCLSGEIRSLSSWDNHLEMIVKPHNCDVFLHTWKKEETSPSDAPFVQRGNWTPTVHSNEESIRKINPRCFHIEDKKIFDPDCCPEVTRVKEWSDIVPRDRCFYMWRSMYMSFLCMSHVQNYDFVIRSRSDLFFGETFPLDFSKIKENTIYIPAGNEGGGVQEKSVCDWFSVGTKSTMEKYVSIYHNSCDLMKRGVPLHPEIMLYNHLLDQNISIERFPLGYHLTARTF